MVIGIAKRDEEVVIHRQKSGVKTDWFERNLRNFASAVRVRQEGEYFAVNLHGQRHSHGHARNLLGETNSEFSDLTKLFQRIRDESHRFAIAYHSSLRTKTSTKNRLEEIPGVGAKTRAKLLRKFGSIRKIEQASEREIAEVVGEKLATKIKQHL